jgi:hypothetical protein
VVFESNPSQITESNVTLKTADTEMVLDNDFTFIFAGGELPFPLLNSIGIEFGKKIEAKT